MKEKIKVLFVTHLFYPAVGGVEVHLKNLGEGLVQRGYEIHVLTTDAYSTEAFFYGDNRRIPLKTETINGVTIERLSFCTFGRSVLNFFRHLAYRVPYPFKNFLRFYSFGPRNRRFIDRIISIDPDIILAAPLPTFNIYYAFKAAFRLNKPLIVIPCYHIFDPGAFFNPIHFKILRSAQAVIAHTPVEKDYLCQTGGIDAAKIFSIPPMPLTLDRLNPQVPDKASIKARYGITESFVVLYLGQQGLHKNVHAVVQAMAHVHRQLSGVALVIAGGTSSFTPVLKEQAAHLKETTNGNTYFIDNFPASEKNDIFQMADIFISLSEKESFGIVFVEALNNGLPVIASKKCVARSIIEEFQSGILVDPENPLETAGAIIELLTDEVMREKYSRNAAQRAVSAFHPEFILNTWESILRSLLSHPKPNDGSESGDSLS